MQRKFYLLVVVAIMLTMVFGACADVNAVIEEPTATAEQTTTEGVVEEATTEEGGLLTLAGSTSVQPLAEELAEAYMDLHPGVVVEVQGGGSSAGVAAAVDGTANIGNASRNLKDSEKEEHPELVNVEIAYDGIAVVANPSVGTLDLSVEQVRAIFSGEVTNFSEVGGPDEDIIVINREASSGTRGAFTELVMEYKDDAGEKQEAEFTVDAIEQASNGNVRTFVSETPNSIGYISFGFLDDSTAPANIDGVAPSIANVLNGSYGIFRPFNMITNGAAEGLAAAFLDFVMSEAGQAIVAEEYIPVATEEAAMEEQAATEEGILTLAGSTSVQPLAEVLAEAYMALNPAVVVEVQGGGSSAGVAAAVDGTANIGNASRNLKDSEKEEHPELVNVEIAYDGIAVVANPGVGTLDLTPEQVRAIFSGEVTNFSEVGGPDAEIIVINREASSGTRGAFTELVMEYKDDAGEKQEAEFTVDAIEQASNGNVRTFVSETPNSIGYISFGFLDDSTAPANIDGVAPSIANVLNGSYGIFRPFNMITNGAAEGLAADFLAFVMSEAGQAIVAEDYIPVATEEAAMEEQAAMETLEGTLTLAGSTSVQPLAEVLAEEFMALYPDVIVEVQGGGSSAGVAAAVEGTANIGNASRNLKDSEKEEHPELVNVEIAYDGIAVVANAGVGTLDLTPEQVRAIFSGEITNFSEVGGPDAEIIVINREAGSGTRGAFTELVMEYKDDAGEKQEAEFTVDAIEQASNGNVRTFVAETPNSIGYISFGFLDDSTAPASINGVAPSIDNVLNGSYGIYRPFNMITNGAAEGLAAAFLDYVMSADGQAVVAEEYIPAK